MADPYGACGESVVVCPDCGTELAIPYKSRSTGRGTAQVSFDTSGVRAHITEHENAAKDPR